MKWQVIVPHLAPAWNLKQFLDQVGKVEVPFLLIDNSPSGDSRSMDIPDGIEVLYHPENLGVPMSWNVGITRGAEYTLIMSVSSRFGNNGGLSEYLEGAEKVANEYGFHSPIGGHCHAVGKQLIKEIGLADASFFPGYKEDSDWGHRMRTLGIEDKMVRYEPKGLYIVASAVAVKSATFLDQRPREREEYYLAKWGGSEGREIYTHPFNDPTKPIQYWPQPEMFKGRGLPEWDWIERL